MSHLRDAKHSQDRFAIVGGLFNVDLLELCIVSVPAISPKFEDFLKSFIWSKNARMAVVDGLKGGNAGLGHTCFVSGHPSLMSLQLSSHLQSGKE